MSASSALNPAPSLFSSTCWIECGFRFIFLVVLGYMVMQCRHFLPNIVREVLTTLAFGSACFWAISKNLFPVFWYITAFSMVLGYLGAHWQFFRTKNGLQKAFPRANPPAHAVNEALDSVETYRQCYKVAPLIFLAAHVGFVTWSTLPNSGTTLMEL